MSEIKNENEDDGNITVSKIYQTLKSGFLDSLYWEVLSDLKERDTFKNMRKSTEILLNKKTEVLSNLPDSEAEKRQRIVAEICTMSYAVDTVYSKILYRKLQNGFKFHVIDVIKDLRQEGKVPDSVWSNLHISDNPEIKDSNENSTTRNSSLQQKPETSSRPVRLKRIKHTKVSPVELATKNKEIRSEIHKDLKAINCDEGKMAMCRNITKVSKKLSPPIEKNPKKKQAAENQIPSKLKTAGKTLEERGVPKEDIVFVLSDNPVSKQLSPKVEKNPKKKQTDENQIPSKLKTVTKTLEDRVVPKDDTRFDNTVSKKLPPSVEKNLKKKQTAKNQISSNLKPVTKTLKDRVTPKEDKQLKNPVSKKLPPKVEKYPKKKQTGENQIPSKSKTVTETLEDKVIPKEDMQLDNPESDAESEISVGNVSITSVSSVHTSDLSSFDDAISLSSEDGENDKKIKFTLKQLEEMSSTGALSPKLNDLMTKGATEKFSPIKSGCISENADSSTEVKSPSQETSSKRKRKPNSKYNSDNILCTLKKVKERTKRPAITNDAKSSSDENNSKHVKTLCDINSSSDCTQTRKRVKREASDAGSETPSKNIKLVKVKEEEDSEFEFNSQLPQCKSSQLYEPHLTVPSLTSRKTGPVILYST